jgi:ADP-heptose:LPS heptosyltransferase
LPDLFLRRQILTMAPTNWSDLRYAERPVAFFSNGIGDALLALPALRALCEIFAGRLTLVCDAGAHQVLFHELYDCRIVELTNMRKRDRVRSFDVEAVVAATGPVDLFLSLVPWRAPSLTALIHALEPGLSVGFHPEYDLDLRPRGIMHSADLAFLVPQLIDSSKLFENFGAPPRLQRAAAEMAADLRKNLPAWARVLVVHPDTDAAKCWSVEHLIALLNVFLAQRREFIVWVVGLPYGPINVGAHAGRIVSCVGLPLDISIGLVGQADFFIGVDSCMLHAADLFRIPGVGLFGPTNPAEWGFRIGPQRHVCGIGTLEHITVESVLRAIDDLLGVP